MAIEPSIPDYKRDILKCLLDFKEEFNYLLKHPNRLSTEKIKDFKGGIKNLKRLSLILQDDEFQRKMDRFFILINNLSNDFETIKRDDLDLIFERLNNLIKHLE
ncbi:MAG: hypothetical protein K1060chlam5_00878 [Candidatus Anoxychlamydiales bacterium]|nr:hypothetical protein [Candidatus Anoxychlamydiales bacterium]